MPPSQSRSNEEGAVVHKFLSETETKALLDSVHIEATEGDH